MKFEYLTMEQVDILLKCYYQTQYTRVAKAENTTVNKIRRIKETALRTIRLSYSKSHMQGFDFDGSLVLQYMAKCSGLKAKELSDIFNQYISEGGAF